MGPYGKNLSGGAVEISVLWRRGGIGGVLLVSWFWSVSDGDFVRGYEVGGAAICNFARARFVGGAPAV